MFDFLIHSAVEHFARVTPDQPAFLFNGEAQTYAELEVASRQLAAALIEGGVKPEDRVGIFMRKGLELGTAIYGILRSGAAFVPLDPSLPAERLAFILEDCGIDHLVTADDRAEVLAELSRKGLQLYGVSAEVSAKTNHAALSWKDLAARDATEELGVELIDLSLAYIMYTSGSTGEPKGMMHTHSGSLSYARWGAQHVALTAADRVASHAPLHFDLSIFDFFSTSQVGGTVVLVPEPVTKFPASLTELMASAGVSVMFTVPFTLIEVLERGALEERDWSALRWILFGGEPFPPKHLRALMQAWPEVRFTNVYGPAEAPSCTCYDLPGPPVGDEAIPIGTVSVNSLDRIVNENGEQCAVGEEGELCIRSSTLTRGYWNRPELNRRVFLESPGLGHHPDIYFRTGDVVCRHEDGLLRFLGRRDRMVKTRGHRVELDEVEAALAAHADVLEAAAFAVRDPEASSSIYAAVTLRPESALSPGDLLRFARTKIPVYALPREIEVLQEFPRTSGGKVNRKQLAETKVTQL